MLRPVSALALSLLLTLPAFGQEVIVDAWYEESVGYQKMGYTHQKVTKTEKGLIEEIREWWPVAGGVSRSTSRIETDLQGRLVRWEKSETNALGTSHESGQLEGKVLRWRCQRRDQKECSGEIEGAVYDSGLVALLIARGERKPGEQKLRVLDLPKGTKTLEFTAEREGDRLHFGGKNTVRIYDDSGKCEQVLRTDYVGEKVLASEAQAKDMARKPQVDDRLATPGRFEREGVELVSPGKGWGLAAVSESGTEEAEPAMLIHPYEVLLMTLPLAVPIPAEDAGLEMLLPQMRTSLDANNEDLTYGEGKIAKVYGLKGLEYPIHGLFNGKSKIQGHVWILRRNSSQSLMVMCFGPADKVAETKGLLAEARQALKVAPLAEGAGEARRVKFPHGLSLELPKGWTRQPKGGREQWVSPAGSHIAVWLQDTGGLPAAEVAERWGRTMADKFGCTASEVVRWKLGTRELCRTELSVENEGIVMKMRLIVGDTSGNESFLMMAIDTPLETKGALKKIFGSAKWKD